MSVDQKVNGPAKRPCASCPYRRDVPSGVWSRDEYEKLPRYDGETWSQPPGLFHCHQHDLNDERTRLCAGWVAALNAVHGGRDDRGGVFEALSIRLALGRDDLDVETVEVMGRYETDVPIWHSGADACEHGLSEIEDPSPEAVAVIEKIGRKRTLLGDAG